MRKSFIYFLALCTVSWQNPTSEENELSQKVEKSLNNAVKQYKLMNKTLPDSLLPRSVNPDGSLRMSKSYWWTSGFFPGSLWYLFEYSKDPEIEKMAFFHTMAVEKEKWNHNDHDIGFKIFCSFGNGLRITHDSSFIPVILTAANTLTTRFNPVVGCIRSWGSRGDTSGFKVIVDNMMNLELLFWATKQTGDSLYYKIAVSHADKTLLNHYRPDGSSYHLVSYDPKTGDIQYKKTVQGYADESAWARGQAWGLYGYTMSYRETGLKRYLTHAQKIANFLLLHPNLPDDNVPFWDFNAPDIPNAKRDASSAAIIASALFGLSEVAQDTLKSFYLENAKKILLSLSNLPYRSELGENNNFLLKHSVGNMPENGEVDVPLSYADYYYIEAMMRYLQSK